MTEAIVERDERTVHAGRTLHGWIAVLRHPKSTLAEHQAAEAAIKAMGTNVIPGILKSFDRGAGNSQRHTDAKG